MPPQSECLARGDLSGARAGACSFDGAVRRTEVPSLARWLKGDAAEQDIIEERKRLSEIFIMGLRTVRGWKKSEFSQFSRVVLAGNVE